MPRAFFDTNIVLYTDDQRYPAKRERALQLLDQHIRSGTAVLSLQVLQEYYAASTRKLGLPADLAHAKVEILSRLAIVRLEPADILSAIELNRLSQLSFWDALIIRAAEVSGATLLYSEDMQADSKVRGVQIVNPFQAE